MKTPFYYFIFNFILVLNPKVPKVIIIVYTVKEKYYDLRYGGGGGKGAEEGAGVGRMGEKV